MKKVCGTISFIGFMALLGTTGSVECGNTSCGTGVISMLCELAVIALSWFIMWRIDEREMSKRKVHQSHRARRFGVRYE